MEPVARYTKTEAVIKRVYKIIANENCLEFFNGEKLYYDILCINVGSRTRDAWNIPGVDKYTLSTRPINDLLGKIERKEESLIERKVLPKVIVCGAGCAGVELAFGFKARWEKLFKSEIEVSLITSGQSPLPHEKACLVEEVERKLKEKNIKVYRGHRVVEVKEDGVLLDDGTFVEGNVPIWSTGAEPQKVTERSDLEISKGYFRVNEFLQSTSHPNVFGGGDCITMSPYEDLPRPFPPKAGVYAVRAGPVLAKNIAAYIKKEPLNAYAPQGEFLALLMTGDGKAIGTKFGIAFTGKWVWKMKDYIDVSFMNLFE